MFKSLRKSVIASIAMDKTVLTMDLVGRKNKLYSIIYDFDKKHLEKGSVHITHPVSTTILEQLVMGIIYNMFVSTDGILYLFVEKEGKIYVEIDTYSHLAKLMSIDDAEVANAEHRVAQF